jgi:hypothetical protein
MVPIQCVETDLNAITLFITPGTRAAWREYIMTATYAITFPSPSMN